MKNLGMHFCLATAVGVGIFAGCTDVPGERISVPIGGANGRLDSSGSGGALGANPLQPQGAPVGGDCSAQQASCRVGLSCESDKCAPAGTSAPGSQCVIGPECAEGLACFLGPCPIPGVNVCPVCQPAGEGVLGDPCDSDLSCEGGLRCGLNGLAAECVAAGETSLGGECSAQSDCYQGLFCNGGQCSLTPPQWSGVQCAEQDDENVEALFVVPGASDSSGDATFFTLPYPSDIRLGSNGRPDLSGFPTPGAEVLGVDLVQRYVEAIESKSEGWSANPSIIFRFSGEMDFASFTGGANEAPRVFMSDVTALPDTPNGSFSSLGIKYSAGSGSKYVCDDWFALQTGGEVLVPHHTYIAWITTAVRSAKGKTIARSAQFGAMLDDAAPQGDDALALAHTRYAPLRKYLKHYAGTEREVDPATLLTAVVFTVEDALKPMRELKAAVELTDVPTATGWVECKAGVSSPCAQAEASENRACGDGSNSDYTEYQALVTLPIFQEGTAPYLRAIA